MTGAGMIWWRIGRKSAEERFFSMSFNVHWSKVQETEDNCELFALWPSPVSADECFQAAGFSDFGDGDDSWEENAANLLTRLLEQLATFGELELLNKPVEEPQSWLRRIFRGKVKRPVYPLRQQIELSLQWDNLPDCLVKFGDKGVTMRTGSGHHLFWITLPLASPVPFQT